jgi:hypothetical protein
MDGPISKRVISSLSLGTYLMLMKTITKRMSNFLSRELNLLIKV